MYRLGKEISLLKDKKNLKKFSMLTGINAEMLSLNIKQLIILEKKNADINSPVYQKAKPGALFLKCKLNLAVRVYSRALL